MFKIVKEKPAFTVNELGEVISTEKGTPCNVWINEEGYKYTSASYKGKQYMSTVHRLVALAFLPNPESKPQINHINSCRVDNRLSNLEWCTPKENKKHADNHGRGTVSNFGRGVGHYANVHSEATVRKACMLIVEGWRDCDIDRELGIHDNKFVGRLRRHEHWTCISEEYFEKQVPKPRAKKLTEEEVRWVCEKYQEGKTWAWVADNSRLTVKQAKEIKFKQTYKNIVKEYSF